MQRVAVAAQPVEERLIGARRVGHDLVGLTRRQRLGRQRALVVALGVARAAEPARAADEERGAMEKAGSPLAAWRDSLSRTTRPAAPLSYMPATVVVVDTVPAAGISPCRRMDCSPWTSMAGSKSPSDRPAAALADDGGERRQDALGHAVGVLRRELELEPGGVERAGADAEGVEEGVLGIPRPLGGLGDAPTASRFSPIVTPLLSSCALLTVFDVTSIRVMLVKWTRTTPRR